MLPATTYSAREKLEKSARELLYGSALFFPLRSAYQHVFNRQKRLFRRKMRDFYAPFVYRGNLVFDVGANIGEYSDIFSSLGDRVVAIEPNPACCESLYRLAHMREVRVEGCAVGESAGSVKMRICDQPDFSTLSERWLERTKESPDHQNVKWLDTIDVPVTTL